MIRLRLFFFKGSFRLGAKLRRRYRDFSCTPCAPHTHGLPHYLYPQQGGTFVMVDEPTLTLCNHSKTCFTFWFILGVVLPISLVKCIMTHTHHFGFIQSIFTTLRIIFVLSLHRCPLPQSLATTDFFFF